MNGERKEKRSKKYLMKKKNNMQKTKKEIYDAPKVSISKIHSVRKEENV